MGLDLQVSAVRTDPQPYPTLTSSFLLHVLPATLVPFQGYLPNHPLLGRLWDVLHSYAQKQSKASS